MSEQDRRDNIDAPPARGGSLAAELRRLQARWGADLHVASPGTVVSYEPTTQIAICTRGFLFVDEISTPAGAVEQPYPPTPIRARVGWQQGSTHSDTAPILPGDTGLLVFCDRALDQWYLQGGAPVDPQSGRNHDLADALFLPGLATPNALLPTPPTIPTARTIEAPIIALGAGAVAAVDNVAIARLVHTYLTALLTAATPTPNDGGAGLKATALAYLAANDSTAFAATKVLAE